MSVLKDERNVTEEEVKLIKQSLADEAKKQLFCDSEKQMVDAEKACYKNVEKDIVEDYECAAGYLLIMGECLREFNNVLVGAELNVIVKFIEDLYEKYLEMKDLLIKDREASFQLKKQEHEYRTNKVLMENKKEKLKLENSYYICIDNLGQIRKHLIKEDEQNPNNSENWEKWLKDKFEIQRRYEEELFRIEKSLQYQLEKEAGYFEEELKQTSHFYNKQMSERMNHNLAVAITGFFDSEIFTTRIEKYNEFKKDYMSNENIRHKYFIRDKYYKFEKEYYFLIRLIKAYSKSVSKLNLFDENNTLRFPELISLTV